MQHDRHVSTRIDHILIQIEKALEMPMITGTSHFVSFTAACEYYADYGYDAADVQKKIDAGEIFIGLPPRRDGQKLSIIDNGTRYAIEEA